MKKLLSILLLAAPAYAGSITVTTTTATDALILRAMNRENRTTCKHYAQAPGCTQAQARKEFCRRAGFGGVTTCDNSVPPVCTTTPLVANCDGANQVDIFDDTSVFFSRNAIRLFKAEYGAKDKADVDAAAAAAKAGTQAQRDAYCVAIGLAAGCLD